ncbi:MAG: LPS export ABC transporter ATP-binding protein [Candidatus Ratteibacteria bacterium]|nr:LPS export ABC transporter ATP-binding protein [Candidatus Ratteibacteria bacterium]
MLQTIHLKKRFGQKEAVKDISISVEKGEIVGLLGPNGAGKTTTFEMIVGFLHPDSGSILLDDKDISGLPVWKRAREGLLYLPQEISLFNKLTVEENIYIILEDYYKDRKEMEEICHRYLKKVGLFDLRKNIAGTLSGGEKRRLEIGRCLTLNPKFFLLDEPFSGIDPKTVYELQDTIEELKRTNIGILLTDHNVRDALRITDRAYLIHKGEILIEGTPEEILSHPDSRKVYFGEKFEI